MKNFLHENFIWICTTIIIPITIWFYSKRHFQKRELLHKDKSIDSIGADVLSKNLQLYQKMIDDIEERYERKLQQRDAEIKFLELEIEIHKKEKDKEVQFLLLEIENLKKKIKDCFKK